MFNVELSIRCGHMRSNVSGNNAKDMWRAILSISYKASQNGMIYDVLHVVDTLSRFNVRDAPR